MAATERFPRAQRWRRGYDRVQVDRYLRHVETALATGRAELSAADIRKVGFDLMRGGYEVSAVDARLDDLELRAVQLERERSGGQQGLGVRSVDEIEPLRRVGEARRGRRFPRVASLRPGYATEAVDDFVGRLAATLTGRGDEGPDLHDVRGVVFPPRRGGYDEDAVDDFLDRVVDVLLRRTA